MAAISSSLLLPVKKPATSFVGLKACPVQTRTVVAFRPSLAPRHLQICCAKADEETVNKVKEVICKQLAVASVQADSKFSDLGADSLDTVEIMMALEEKFEISLNQEGNEKILTVQDAADLIHDYCQAKGAK